MVEDTQLGVPRIRQISTTVDHYWNPLPPWANEPLRKWLRHRRAQHERCPHHRESLGAGAASGAVLPTTWASRRRAATTSDLPATSDLPTTAGLVDFAAVGGVVTGRLAPVRARAVGVPLAAPGRAWQHRRVRRGRDLNLVIRVIGVEPHSAAIGQHDDKIPHRSKSVRVEGASNLLRSMPSFVIVASSNGFAGNVDDA